MDVDMIALDELGLISILVIELLIIIDDDLEYTIDVNCGVVLIVDELTIPGSQDDIGTELTKLLVLETELTELLVTKTELIELLVSGNSIDVDDKVVDVC